MTFIYPGFLYALSLLAIPVIIHLFSFRRSKKVYFSNTRFLHQVKVATASTRRLKHYLILASRLLFLLFLVLAFAQPFIPAREQQYPGKEVAIYLDNSLSMSGRTGDKMSAFDTGMELVRQILELFPADTKYLLLTNDFEPFSNTFKSRAEAEDVMTQIRLTPVSRSMAEVENQISQHSSGGEEIFWISDFQRSTLGDVQKGLFDSTSTLHLVPLQFRVTANIFVDTAYLENPFVVGGERNKLIVKLRNAGSAGADQLLVKVLIDGVQSGTATLAVPAGAAAQTSFDLNTRLSGSRSVVITFDDNPVNFDNEFYLTLNFSELIRVVEIKPKPDVTAMERVFGNDEVFTFNTFTQGNVNYNIVNRADLVILNGLDNLPGPLSRALEGYVDNFGSLLVIPGPRPDIESLRSFVMVSSAHPGETESSMELSTPDYNNPFFENVFEERTERLSMPQAKRILDWGPDPSAILKFRDGTPFLSRVAGNRKVYVLACPLGTDYTNFSNNALFVPVMYRLAASGKRNDFRSYYPVNAPTISVKLDTMVSDVPLRLVGNNEIIPQQRRLGDQINFEMPRFSLEQGFYRVVYAQDTIAHIALNLDKAESLLDQYDIDELIDRLGVGSSVSVFDATSPETFSNEIKTRYLGKPLWKYAVALALLFLGCEIMLIRFLK